MNKKPIFSEKQLEIMDMVAEGMSVRQISRALNVSDTWIKFQRMKIREEIELPKEKELKDWLYEHGWDKPETR